MGIAMRRYDYCMCLTMLLMLSSPTAGATAYPDKPIRLVVPYPAGASNEIIGRALGNRLAEEFGRNVIIDTRPGGGGQIGAEIVARSAPDGYTLLLGTAGLIAISPHVYAKLPYAFSDFAAVSLFASVPYVMAVPAALPVKDVREMVALSRSKPGWFNYASSGNASAPHLCGEQLKLLTGADMTHVPYKGGAAAVADLITNQVQLYCGGIPTVRAQVQTGRLKIIATTTAQRSRLMPEQSTVAEQGISGFEVNSWMAILAPAKTPAAVIDRLYGEIAKAMQRREMQDFVLSQGAEPAALDPKTTAARFAEESARWGKVARAAMLRVD